MAIGNQGNSNLMRFFNAHTPVSSAPQLNKTSQTQSPQSIDLKDGFSVKTKNGSPVLFLNNKPITDIKDEKMYALIKNKINSIADPKIKEAMVIHVDGKDGSGGLLGRQITRLPTGAIKFFNQTVQNAPSGVDLAKVRNTFAWGKIDDAKKMLGVQGNAKPTIEIRKGPNIESYILKITEGKDNYELPVTGDQESVKQIQDKLQKLIENAPKPLTLELNEKYELKIKFPTGTFSSDETIVKLSREVKQDALTKLAKALGTETPLVQFYKGASIHTLKSDPSILEHAYIQKDAKGNYEIRSHQGVIAVAVRRHDAVSLYAQICEAVGHTKTQSYFDAKAEDLFQKRGEPDGLKKFAIHLHQGRKLGNPSFTSVYLDKSYKSLGNDLLSKDQKTAALARQHTKVMFEVAKKLTQSSPPGDPLIKIKKSLGQLINENVTEKRQNMAVDSFKKGLENVDRKGLEELVQWLSGPNRFDVLPPDIKMRVMKGTQGKGAEGRKIIDQRITELRGEIEKVLEQVKKNEAAGGKGDINLLKTLSALYIRWNNMTDNHEVKAAIENAALSPQAQQTYRKELAGLDYFLNSPTPQKKLEILNNYINHMSPQEQSVLCEKLGLTLPLTIDSVKNMDLVPIKFLTEGGGREGTTYLIGVKDPSSNARKYVDLTELKMSVNRPDEIRVYGKKEGITSRAQLIETFAKDNKLPPVKYFVGLMDNGSVYIPVSVQLSKNINAEVEKYAGYLAIAAGVVATVASGGLAAGAGAVAISVGLHTIGNSLHTLYVDHYQYGTMNQEEFQRRVGELGMSVAMMATGPIKGFTGTLIRTGLMIPDSIHTYQALNDPNLTQAEKNEAFAFFALNAAMFLMAERGSLRTHLAEMRTKNPAMYKELGAMGITEKTVPTSNAKKWLKDKMNDYLSDQISRNSKSQKFGELEIHTYGSRKPINGKDSITFYDGTKPAVKILKGDVKAYYDLEPPHIKGSERSFVLNKNTGELIRPQHEFFAQNLPPDKFLEMNAILKVKDSKQFIKFCEDNGIKFQVLESEAFISPARVFEEYHGQKSASIATTDSNMINDSMQRQIASDKNLVRGEVQPANTAASNSDSGSVVLIRGEKNTGGKIVYAKENFAKETLVKLAKKIAGTKGVQNKAKVESQKTLEKSRMPNEKVMQALEKIFLSEKITDDIKFADLVEKSKTDKRAKVTLDRILDLYHNYEGHSENIALSTGKLPSGVHMTLESRGLQEEALFRGAKTGNGDVVYHADLEIPILKDGKVVKEKISLVSQGDRASHGADAAQFSFVFDAAHDIALKRLKSHGSFANAEEALALYSDTRNRYAGNAMHNSKGLMATNDFFVTNDQKLIVTSSGGPRLCLISKKTGEIKLIKPDGFQSAGMNAMKDEMKHYSLSFEDVSVKGKHTVIDLKEYDVFALSDGYADLKHPQTGEKLGVFIDKTGDVMTTKMDLLLAKAVSQQDMSPHEYVRQEIKKGGYVSGDDETWLQFTTTPHPKENTQLKFKPKKENLGSALKKVTSDFNKEMVSVAQSGHPQDVIKYFNEKFGKEFGKSIELNDAQLTQLKKVTKLNTDQELSVYLAKNLNISNSLQVKASFIETLNQLKKVGQ